MSNNLSDQPFKNHFCPCCLSPVDAVNGDHWHYCEYESNFGDWVNPVQPLTEIEMLEAKLSLIKKSLKTGRKIERDLKSQVIAIKTKISAAAKL